MADVQAVVPHQANGFMLKHLSKRMKIPEEKMLIALDEYGKPVRPPFRSLLPPAWPDVSSMSRAGSSTRGFWRRLELGRGSSRLRPSDRSGHSLRG